MKKISLSMLIFASVFALFLTVHTGASAEDLDALKERAEQGDTDAQLGLGRMYFDGRGDYRGTIPEPPLGSKKPRNKETRTHSTKLAIYTTMDWACRRTRSGPPRGRKKPRNKDTQTHSTYLV